MAARALAMLLLAACVTTPASPTPPASPSPPAAAATLPGCPTAAAPPEAATPPSSDAATPDELAAAWAHIDHLRPDDVLLQLEREPSFALVRVVDPMRAFGRLTAVTLYRDGTVVAAEGGGYRFWNRGERIAEQDLDHIWALGSAQLRNHTSQCWKHDRGRTCVSDAAIVHLRIRQPDGELRELVNYGGFSDTHQARLDAIYDRLQIIATPPSLGPGRVRPYTPEHASLFLRVVDEPDVALLPELPPWPLAPLILGQALRDRWVVVTIDRPQILALQRGRGSRGGIPTFRWDDRVVQAEFVPWLPGVDHHGAIEATKLGE